jgi:hypothetical protein
MDTIIELKQARETIARLRSLFLCPRHDEGREECCTCDEYLILALDRSVGRDILCWWKPNNSGYTIFVEEAGRYTKKQITEKAGYYDNGEALAVPLKEVCQNSRLVAYRDDWGADLMNAAQTKADNNAHEMRMKAEEYQRKFSSGVCPRCESKLKYEDYSPGMDADSPVRARRITDFPVRVTCSDRGCKFATSISRMPAKKEA